MYCYTSVDLRIPFRSICPTNFISMLPQAIIFIQA
uniref:Uncharacterized protein n=1 Tax=Anguilla anguilla TaxID=7936 RepID=A0A0E9PAP2_ANGAN